MHNDALSLDDVATALGFVPAYDRDVWVRMAMAVKSEFGEAGFDLWDNWSATADNYNSKAARATWRSVKPGGAIGIGSLIHEAQQHGFTFERRELTPEQKQQQQAEQEKRRIAREQAEREFEAWQRAWHARIAEAAQQIWQEHCHVTGSSKYLGQKKCGAHGVGFVREGFLLQVDEVADAVTVDTDQASITAFFKSLDYENYKNNGKWFLHAKRGTLVVPLRDVTGVIHNLQFIFTDKKQFIKNGRKSGLFHLLGNITPHTTALLVAEGYATAATLHEATRHPVAMAIDSGNLMPVAQALRGTPPMHNALHILICGDDDTATEGNPGRTSAEKAAAFVGGVAVFPVFENAQEAAA